jgi:transposase-like protein
MTDVQFSEEQTTLILSQLASGKEGYDRVLKIAFEALMKAERHEHLVGDENLTSEPRDLGNGYRTRKTYGQGKTMELQVPRTRLGQFYPMILGILKDQEAESRKLAFSLYGKGLTTEQVGDLFEEVYGEHYGKSSISRMFDFAREEVTQWLTRPLDPYYAIVCVDATFIFTRRGDNVSKEAYYTVLGVKADRTRDVLAVVNTPTESATGWKEILLAIKARGVKEITLAVSDGLSGLEDALAAVYPMVRHQLCVVHLERNVINKIKPSDKPEVAEELKYIFRTGDYSYTQEQGWEAFKTFTEKWGTKYPSLKTMGNNQWYRKHFTYLGFDPRIQKMIYTTNWIERLNRDYKRVTRMRGALPSPEATLLLLGHVAMTRKAYWRKVPLLNHDPQFKWAEG